MALPRSAGDLTVRAPALSNARNLSAAVPLPPAMTAPACPMRLPGGAVTPGDVRDHRLGDVLADEVRGGFFVRAADLADHDDAFGLRIPLEELQHIDEVHAAHRIAADADAGALAEALVGGLEHGFVGQRARARHDADAALLVDEARHDADLAFARRDDARAVRPDEPRAGSRRAWPSRAPCR